MRNDMGRQNTWEKLEKWYKPVYGKKTEKLDRNKNWQKKQKENFIIGH